MHYWNRSKFKFSLFSQRFKSSHYCDAIKISVSQLLHFEKVWLESFFFLVYIGRNLLNWVRLILEAFFSYLEIKEVRAVISTCYKFEKLGNPS